MIAAMPSRRSATSVGSTPTGLVLADTEERRQLHALQTSCDQLTGQIANAELDLETVRADLLEFEHAYSAALADAHRHLKSAERVVLSLDRWADVLTQNERAIIAARVKKATEKKRHTAEDELAAHGAQSTRGEASRAANDTVAEGAPAPLFATPRDDRLKTAFRSLARRYHPDLARSEQERVQFGQYMARINDLYRARDLERLLSLEEQLKGGDITGIEGDIHEQIEALQKRQGWLNVVLGNLRQDRDRLRQSSLMLLREACLERQAQGLDPFAELVSQMMGRVETTLMEVRNALDRLEQTVVEYNRHSLERKQNSNAALTHFDPYKDRRLVRLALEDLHALHASAAAQQWADLLRQRFAERPSSARLALMAYASDLSPYPLAGLERIEDVRLRYEAVNADLVEPESFEPVLASMSDVLEWGIKRATTDIAYAGLRFLHEDQRTAMQLLMRDIGLRRELKRVLYLLGEIRRCPQCESQVFALPLYRLRGLDDLRATVCPDCAHAFSSYWLARGGDVQSVLNDAFVDLEVIHEWSFHIGPGSIAMQVLPKEEAALTVQQLKKRLHEQVFARNELALTASQIVLLCRGKKVAEKTLLEDLPERTLQVQLKPEANLDVVTLLETLKHRIRTRFRR